MQPTSAQSKVALAFLNALESGRTGDAYKMLSRQAQRSYGLASIQANAPKYNPAMVRRIRFEGPISQYQAMIRAPARYYLVCLVDTPVKRVGMVTHIAVTLVPDSASGSGWSVADYRYDAQPHPGCGRAY